MSIRFLVLIFAIVIGTTTAVAEEKPKPELPRVPRIVERVDLADISNAAEFQRFMERHSFPLPPVPLSRFSDQATAGRRILAVTFRFYEPALLVQSFKDFTESLNVNDNLEPDPANRRTGLAVTAIAGGKTASGALLYHNPEAGYSLRYVFRADQNQKLTLIQVLLQPCLAPPPALPPGASPGP